jgi:iron complex outermembrane receptor protein
VYGKYTERDGLEFGNGDAVPDDWYMAQGGFRMDTELSSRDSFTVQGDYYENKIHEELIPGSHPKTSGGNLLGRWTRTFSEDSDFTLQVYYDRTDLTLPSPGFAIGGTLLAPAGVFRDELDTIDVDFQHRFSLGARHRIVWGLGYRYTHDVVENAPPLGFTDGNLDQDLFSAFINDEYALVPERVYLTLGTKVEHNEYTEFEVEPSARLQWHITDRHMLWSAVSRAVRTPSRIDRDIAQPFPPFLTILAGGPDFDSEEVIAYELGYRASIGEYALLSIASFYNEYDDLRSTSLSPPDPVFNLPFPLFFENNLHGETYGIELDLNWQILDWWRLRFGYTFLEEDIRVKPGKFDFNNALNETADPKNQFSVRSAMDLPGNVELDAALRRVDRLPANNAGVVEYVPGYTELNVRLGWRPVESLELSVVGQNLLHDSHPEFGLAGPFRHEIERSVYGRIVWTP